MKKLTISSELSLPLNAVTQTLACIGRRGAGKTYLAQMIAEQMLDLGAQIVVIDPIGNWFGLRIGADGKSKGKDIFIAGGDHGDVPVLPDSGARFARLVVEKNISIILDISSFKQTERKRFAADFAEEFYHLKKKQKSAVHLFIEEAQLFIPQRFESGEARMVGAFESIIRLGRNYGIGATMISQRPQSVNKEVLSQTECLCVLQVNGTHERRALDEWVQEAGADRKLIGELPGLGRGEGYVWSPSWLRTFQRVHFSQKTTFDASATPEVGRAAKAALLTAMDVETLRADLQEVIAQAKANDVRALQARIHELEVELALKDEHPLRMVPNPDQIAAIISEELEKYSEDAARFGQRLANELDDSFRHVTAAMQRAQSALRSEANWKLPFSDAQAVIMASKVGLIENPADSRPTRAAHAPTRMQNAISPVWAGKEGLKVNSEPSGDQFSALTGPEKRILSAMAQLKAVGLHPCPRVQVALLADYSNQTSTGFAKGISTLSTKGLICYPSPGMVGFTSAGLEIAPPVEPLRSNTDLHAKLLTLMPGPESKLLTVLVQSSRDTISRQFLAERSGYGNVTSTGFAKAISRLSSLGLIEYPDRGTVRGKDVLFPFGR